VSLPWQPQSITLTETPNEKVHIRAPEGVAPNSRGVVLLVEDNPTNIEVIGDYLQFNGYTLVIATNGVDALIKSEESNPDLILMDIQMPVMNGLEATRRLRADPRFVSTPIISLTALAMDGDRDSCLEAGANDYISKPVILKELLEKIEQLL
jgi:CheY-like chemotaxis protein